MSKLRIVVTSDWHLDSITSGIRRRCEIENAIVSSVQTAINKNAHFYFMLGDLSDPNNVRLSSSIATTIESIKYLKHTIPVFITGNHDVIEDGSGDHTMLPLKAIGYRVFDYPIICKFTSNIGKNINLVALPYTPSCCSYDPVRFIKDHYKSIDNTYPTIVIGHLNIDGIIPGSETIDMPRGREVFLPITTIKKYIPNVMIYNGHYHRSQSYNGVVIPGSLARLTFGERLNKPGYMYIEV